MEADAEGVYAPDAIDWSRVRAATYRIEQRFRYEYPGPIRDLRQRLVLAPPRDEPHAAVLAFLADGESWSSSALALALGASPRTVQRALEQLGAAGKAQSFGLGRARRWAASPLPGFPTILLLPGPLPGD